MLMATECGACLIPLWIISLRKKYINCLADKTTIRSLFWYGWSGSGWVSLVSFSDPEIKCQVCYAMCRLCHMSKRQLDVPWKEADCSWKEGNHAERRQMHARDVSGQETIEVVKEERKQDTMVPRDLALPVLVVIVHITSPSPPNKVWSFLNLWHLASLGR